MRLLGLGMVGFKSFAKKTTFRFGPGITAIIGPNGAGKSNVAEAIRWVLGEQSLKSLRGKKSEDVIFSGSDTYRSAGSASVSIIISNESGRLPVEAAEVTITRAINRAGEGEYLLNGDPVRLSDIQQILAEAGLGTKSYAVISQGTVDRYLIASPQVRRELFDEATGVKALQLKLAKAERSLTQAEQRIHELNTVMQELEPRLRVLKRQVQRFAERDKTERQYQKMLSSWYRAGWHAKNADIVKAKALLEAVSQRIREARSARERVESTLFVALAGQPKGKTSVDNTALPILKEQLKQAERAYEQALSQYQQRQQEKKEISESLDSIRSSLAEAQERLAQARSVTSRRSVKTQVAAALKQFRAAIARWREGKKITTRELNTLDDGLAQALGWLSEETSQPELEQDYVARLTEPLQAVARWQAIKQEREQRLARLADLQPPSADEVGRLRATTAAAQAQDPAGQERAALEHNLADVRAKELEAEREGSAAEAACSAAQQDFFGLEQEIKREKGSGFLTETQNTLPTDEDLSVTAAQVKAQASRLAALGEADPLVEREYQEASSRYEFFEKQLTDVTATHQNTSALVRSLKRDIAVRFREQFTTIQHSFKNNFRKLFDGGMAQLEIIEAQAEGQLDDMPGPQATVQGIEVTARPPGKKPQHINLLSGGEKALTSLALLLAIIEVQKPPFLVLDEVDAALDEANSARFAAILHTMGQTTQCVVITHNREVMASANLLYGITMDRSGVSQRYSVKMDEINETEAAEEMRV